MLCAARIACSRRMRLVAAAASPPSIWDSNTRDWRASRGFHSAAGTRVSSAMEPIILWTTSGTQDFPKGNLDYSRIRVRVLFIYESLDGFIEQLLVQSARKAPVDCIVPSVLNEELA